MEALVGLRGCLGPMARIIDRSELGAAANPASPAVEPSSEQLIFKRLTIQLSVGCPSANLQYFVVSWTVRRRQEILCDEPFSG
jgi:hypothetical protein